MTIANWIFLSLSVISVGLYTFSLIKKFELLKKISAGTILPFITALSISFLLNKLPDSRHTITTTIITMSLASITEILFIYENKKFLRIIMSCPNGKVITAKCF